MHDFSWDGYWNKCKYFFIKFNLQYFAPVKAAVSYFPKRRGLCVGLIISGYGLSSTFYNFILTAIINPDSIKPDPITKIYPNEVAHNVPDFVLVIIISIAVFTGVALVLINPYVEEQTKTELEQLIEYHVKSFELFVMPKHKISTERFHFMIKNSPPTEIVPKSQKSDVEGYFNEYSVELADPETHPPSSKKTVYSIEKIEVDYSPEKKVPKRPYRHNSVSWEHANLHTQFLDRHDEVYKMAEHHPKVKASVQTHSLHTAVFSLRTLRYMILLYSINCKLI